jgi:hypothetical protein
VSQKLVDSYGIRNYKGAVRARDFMREMARCQDTASLRRLHALALTVLEGSLEEQRRCYDAVEARVLEAALGGLDGGRLSPVREMDLGLEEEAA